MWVIAIWTDNFMQDGVEDNESEEKIRKKQISATKKRSF